jgi:hypothetical protein
MRLQQSLGIRRRTVRWLLVLALLAVHPPHPVLAVEALIPHGEPADDPAFVQQAGPPALGPSPVQLVPSSTFVEDPTRLAGGEDDAQRAYERQQERQQDQDDDGERRRK